MFEDAAGEMYAMKGNSIARLRNADGVTVLEPLSLCPKLGDL
jgi:hypothetical protein